MAELTNQIQAFGLTLVLGLITGVIFHYYQLFIRQARVGRLSLYFLDMVLWIFIIALVFWAIICINQGEVRFYVLIAWLTGILVYFRTLSNKFHGLLFSLAGQNVRILGWTKRQLKRVENAVKALFRKIIPRRDPPPPPDSD